MLVETERILIEEALVSDSAFYFKLLNSPNWIESIGDRGIKTEDDAITYIKSSLIASYNENGFGLFKMVLKETSHPIGICGFLKRTYLEHPDIGFAILPEFEGKGYTLEAARAVMSYGSETLKLKTIYGMSREENTGSRIILSKIGLNQVGTINPPDEDRTLILYSNE